MRYIITIILLQCIMVEVLTQAITTTTTTKNPEEDEEGSSCDKTCVLSIIASVLGVFFICLIGSIYYATHQDKGQRKHQDDWNRTMRSNEKKNPIRQPINLHELDNRLNKLTAIGAGPYMMEHMSEGVSDNLGYDPEAYYIPDAYNPEGPSPMPQNRYSYPYVEPYIRNPKLPRKNRILSAPDLSYPDLHDIGTRSYSLEERVNGFDEEDGEYFDPNMAFPDPPPDVYFYDYDDGEYPGLNSFPEDGRPIDDRMRATRPLDILPVDYGYDYEEGFAPEGAGRPYYPRNPSDLDLQSLPSHRHPSDGDRRSLSSQRPRAPPSEQMDRRRPTSPLKSALKHSRSFQEIPMDNSNSNVSGSERIIPITTKYRTRSRSLDVLDKRTDESNPYMDDNYQSEASAYNTNEEEAVDEAVNTNDNIHKQNADQIYNNNNTVYRTNNNLETYKNDDSQIKIAVLHEQDLDSSDFYRSKALVNGISEKRIHEERLEDMN